MNPNEDSLRGADIKGPWDKAMDEAGGKEQGIFAAFMLMFRFLIESALFLFDSGAQAQFMKDVASTLGLSYAPTGEMKTVDGGLFYLGTNGKITNVLSGVYGGHPLRVFTYSVMAGPLRGVYLRYLVYELTFSGQLPSVLLRSRKDVVRDEDGGSFKIQATKTRSFHEEPKMKDGVRIQLEGNFNEYFTVETRRGIEADALQILTPDVMEMLIDQKPRLNFESCGSHLYIYSEEFIIAKSQFVSFYEHASELATKLELHFK